MRNALSKSMTTSIPTSSCWRECTRRLKGYDAIGYRICSTASEESVTERQGSGLDKIDVEKLGKNARHGGGAD
jgi:hypothetical protein